MVDITKQSRWQNNIWKLNLAGQVDLELIANEVLMVGKHTKISRDRQPEMEAVHNFQETMVHPRMLQYFQEEYGCDITTRDYYFQSFGSPILDGQGMGPHHHSFSLLTSVFYPISSEAQLVILDPRGVAGRGYPEEVQTKFFSNFRFTPKAGDLIIFPAHLVHMVSACDNDIRLSLISDLMVHD